MLNDELTSAIMHRICRSRSQKSGCQEHILDPLGICPAVDTKDADMAVDSLGLRHGKIDLVLERGLSLWSTGMDVTLLDTDLHRTGHRSPEKQQPTQLAQNHPGTVVS